MAYDLKTAPEDTTLDGDALLFGADSAAATNPSVYKVSSVRNYIIGLANTWTATQTITPGANTSALASTGYSLTGSNAQSLIDLAGTWNTTGTPTALKLNVTDTASNAASLLMDLQTGGTSRASFDKNGALRFAAGASLGIFGTSATFQLLSVGSGSVGVLYQITNGSTSQRSDAILGWAASTTVGTNDTILTRRAAANLRMGAADAAAPVAQTLSVQGVVAGTSNTAGANFTIDGSQGTGTGAGGSIIFRTAAAGSSGTAQNALTRALAITAARSVVVGDNTAALATSATDGFLYVPSCAGTPVGTPTTQTGTVPIVVDSTNHKLYFYSGDAWRDAGP